MSKPEITDVFYNEDDRAQRLLDCFPILPGQVNISYAEPGHIVAWHKHNVQTDYWICLQGAFKVGLTPGDGRLVWYYLSDKRQKMLTIEPGIYHGYMALKPNSILMYYTSHKYDPYDEFRKTIGSFNESWGIENK